MPKLAHFGYMAAISCHEEAFFPSEAFFGIHRGKILPSSDIRERITSTYRHRQALGNAFRGHLAVAERPRAHCEHTLLCAGLRGIQFAGICRHARPPDDAPRQHIVSKATLRLRKGQHARSHRTPPEPIREMRRCPAAAVGAAAMKEPGHWRARPTGGCSYSSVKGDSPFRWAFLAMLTQALPDLRSLPAVRPRTEPCPS